MRKQGTSSVPLGAWRARRFAALCVPLSAVALVVLAICAPMPAAGAASLAGSAHATTTSVRTVPRSYASNRPASGGRYNSTSADWSGYATTGSTYTSVSGSWAQPAVTCAAGETSYAAFWVGLDGDTTRTVEQTGTESDCQNGSPVYSAWYEMYPDAPVTIDRPVAPGDQISASVTTDANGSFTLTLSDATAGWSVSTPATLSRARLGSAEWIAEAPSDGRQPLPLANFGTVTFTNCTANGSALGANPNLDPISMAVRGGTVQAQPSSVAADGATFGITAQPSATSGSGSGSSGSGTTPTQPTPPYPWHHHHQWWENGGWGQGPAPSGSGGFSGWPSLPSSSGSGTPWSSSPSGLPWPTF